MRLKTPEEFERMRVLIRWMLDEYGDGAQTKLAKRLGVKQSTVSNWLNTTINQSPVNHWDSIIRLIDWTWTDLHNYLEGTPDLSLIKKLPLPLLQILVMQGVSMQQDKFLGLQAV
jgi:hypothetical protein